MIYHRSSFPFLAIDRPFAQQRFVGLQVHSFAIASVGIQKEEKKRKEKKGICFLFAENWVRREDCFPKQLTLLSSAIFTIGSCDHVYGNYLHDDLIFLAKTLFFLKSIPVVEKNFYICNFRTREPNVKIMPRPKPLPPLSLGMVSALSLRHNAGVINFMYAPSLYCTVTK